MKTGERLEFTPSSIVRCPCGEWCMIGKNAEGVDGILHHEPMCEQFRQLDALQFLTYLRKYYQARQRPRKARPPRGSN